jgi:hypothetical protein
MSWSLQIPIRTPHDSIGALGFNAAALPSAEDRAIVRELAATATMAGMRTADDLTWALQSMTRSQRRRVLDRLRERCGLKSASDLDRALAGEQRAAANRRKMMYDDRPLRLVPLPGGGYVDGNEAADESSRVAAAEQSRARRHENEEAIRAVEAREREQAERAFADRQRAELPEAFRP